MTWETIKPEIEEKKKVVSMLDLKDGQVAEVVDNNDHGISAGDVIMVTDRNARDTVLHVMNLTNCNSGNRFAYITAGDIEVRPLSKGESVTVKFFNED